MNYTLNNVALRTLSSQGLSCYFAIISITRNISANSTHENKVFIKFIVGGQILVVYYV